MATVPKRSLKKGISSKKQPLPKALAFLEGVKFFTITKQKVNGIRKWHVELSASSLKKLLSAKVELRILKKSHAQLLEACEEAKEESKSIRKHIIALEAANKQLMQNIEEDKRPDYYRKSSPNYFNAAEKHGFKPRGLPSPGGLAGLEHKK